MARRILTALALTALLVGACSNDDDPKVATDASTTTIASAPGAPTTTAASPTPEASDDGTAAPPATTTVEQAPAAQPASPAQQRRADGDAGSFAPQILAGTSTQVVVEVIAQQSAMPRTSTIDHITQTLTAVTGKPATRTDVGEAAPLRDTWTADEIRSVAGDLGTPQSDATTILHVLFLHGRWEESDTVLGVSVSGDTVAVFVDAVEESAGPLVGAGAIEVAATTHEIGHLLGLVDLYLKTGRADPEHPGHSANRESVMYWAVESTLITDVLAGGPPRDFDDDDRGDLATIKAQG